MKTFVVFAVILLANQPCTSRSLNEEDSVVSVYTTLPSTAGAGQGAPLDVYRLIADNIAERITQPFFRFFGLNNNTHETTTTTRPFEHIELGTFNDPHSNKSNPTQNHTDKVPVRDVEELSIDNILKSDKKPEKFTLFSSYLPVKQNLKLNHTLETSDDNIDSNENSLELDDVDADYDDRDSGRQDPFVYILELMGSIIQLLWGGFLALFKPSSTTPSENQSVAS